MLNHRFKNPYKINNEPNEENIENEGDYYDFGECRIYEFNYNNELAPKG